MQNYFFHLLYIYYNRNSEKSQIFNVQGGLIRALPTELSHKSCGSETRTHDFGLTRTNKVLLKPPYMAGVAGFEPTNAGVMVPKVRVELTSFLSFDSRKILTIKLLGQVLCLTNLAIPQYLGKVLISNFPFHLL